MKKTLANLNYPLLILMIVYSTFGLLMVFSASSVTAVLRYGKPANFFFIKQLVAVIAAYFVGFVGILRIKSGYYKFGSYTLMLIIVALLLFIFTAGKVIGGSLSWFDLGLFNFQPTEPAKVVLIIALGCYYQGLVSKKRISFWDMIRPLIVAVALFVLTASQPDFGGAFIIASITALIFISLPIGIKHKHKVILISLGLIGIVGLSVFLFGGRLLHSYQVERLTNFSKPCSRYSEDTGYQVCNGYIAIHNGGLYGVGLGNSSQKYMYLPEAHTDFIFAIICEELGLIVGIAVVIGYFIMLALLLKIAKEASTLRNSIIVYGVFAYLLVHILINLLGILGLIPLTGVPLPFLSYGGSYNVCLILALFVVQKINAESREAKVRRMIEKL